MGKQQEDPGPRVAAPGDVGPVLDDLRRFGVAAVVDGRATGRSTLLDAVAATGARRVLRVVGRYGLADVPLGAVAAATVVGSGGTARGLAAGVGDADEVVRVVRALVGDGRGMVLVDDAHLLHSRDLAVLAAARDAGARVLLSATDEAAWPAGLDAMLHDAPRHRVARLDVDGVLGLCRRVAGGGPDRARAVRLVQLAGGRPGHVLRLLGRDHDVHEGLLRLPPDPSATDEAIAWYRLSTGDDDARRLARLTVRRPVLTVEQLPLLVGAATLHAACDRGLVGVVRDRVELRDPLVAAVAAGHDRRVHGGGDAQLLLDVLGTQVSTPTADGWRAEAGLSLAPASLARVVLETVGRGRPDEALRLGHPAGAAARPAAPSGEDGAAAASDGEAHLAAARAVALAGAGRHEEALTTCEALLEHVEGDLHGRVALLLADLRFFRRGDAAGALAALRAVGAQDPLRPDADAMRDLVRSATDPAGAGRPAPNVGGLAPTPRMFADLLAVLAGRVQGAQDVLVPPVGAGPPGVPVHERALANRRFAALFGAGCEAARPLVEDELDRVLATGRPGAVALALSGVMELEQLEGRLVDAERTAREALLWTGLDDEAGLHDLLVGVRAGLLAELGRLEEARGLLDHLAPRLGDDLRVLLLATPGRVRVLALEDRAAAVRVAREAVGIGLATGHVAWALRAAVDGAQVGLARELVDLVGDLADDEHLGALPRAEAAAVRALADPGAGALVAAADACTVVGRRRVAANLLLVQAPVQEDRRRRAAALLDGLGPPHPDRAGRVEPLTHREEQVARLAAAGLTSRAVGERLGVSVRTVDNHLRRAYRKLGVHGRDELTTVLGSMTAV